MLPNQWRLMPQSDAVLENLRELGHGAKNWKNCQSVACDDGKTKTKKIKGEKKSKYADVRRVLYANDVVVVFCGMRFANASSRTLSARSKNFFSFLFRTRWLVGHAKWVPDGFNWSGTYCNFDIFNGREISTLGSIETILVNELNAFVECTEIQNVVFLSSEF